MARHLLLLCAGLVLSVPSVVRAEAPAPAASAAERAETHSRLGVEFYQQGLYKEAVREMMLAYEAVPDATLLYNVARIYQKMGQPELATGFFKRFVAHEGADPDTVKDALSHMEELEAGPAPTERDNSEVERLEADDSQGPAAPAEEVGASTKAVRAHHPAPVVTTLVAGASLAAMAVTGSLALARNQAAKGQNGEMAWAARMTARNEAVQLGVVADVSLGIGIAASVATVIALLATRKPKAAVMLVPAGPAGDGPGITLSGHFGRRGAR